MIAWKYKERAAAKEVVAELDDAVDALQPLLEFEDAQLKNNKCRMEKRIVAQPLIEKSIYTTNTTFTLFIGLFGSLCAGMSAV